MSCTASGKWHACRCWLWGWTTQLRGGRPTFTVIHCRTPKKSCLSLQGRHGALGVNGCLWLLVRQALHPQGHGLVSVHYSFHQCFYLLLAARRGVPRSMTSLLKGHRAALLASLSSCPAFVASSWPCYRCRKARGGQTCHPSPAAAVQARQPSVLGLPRPRRRMTTRTSGPPPPMCS